MNLRHRTLQKAAKLSQKLWRVVHRVPLKGMPGLNQACINAAAAAENLYDFQSPANRTGENLMICRVSRNPEVRLTVKFRNRLLREFLPSDLPSKRLACGDRSRKAKFTPTQLSPALIST
jgi:hypothetical protein